MLSKDKMLRVVFSILLKILFYKQDSNSLHLLFQEPWEVAKLPGVSQQVAFTALLSIQKLVVHLFVPFSFKPIFRKSIKLNWVNTCAYAFRITEVAGCYNEVQTVLTWKAAYRGTSEEQFSSTLQYITWCQLQKQWRYRGSLEISVAPKAGLLEVYWNMWCFQSWSMNTVKGRRDTWGSS